MSRVNFILNLFCSKAWYALSISNIFLQHWDVIFFPLYLWSLIHFVYTLSILNSYYIHFILLTMSSTYLNFLYVLSFGPSVLRTGRITQLCLITHSCSLLLCSFIGFFFLTNIYIFVTSLISTFPCILFLFPLSLS